MSGDPNYEGGTNNKLFFKEEFEIVGNPTGIISSFSHVTPFRNSGQENRYWIYDNVKVTATSFYDFGEEPEIEENIIGCTDLDADNYGYDVNKKVLPKEVLEFVDEIDTLMVYKQGRIKNR